MATIVHFLPVEQRPQPVDMTTPALVAEFAAIKVNFALMPRAQACGEDGAVLHDRLGVVVGELRHRSVLD